MERRRIQQLSVSLVNRIAAGEVIERPASVVKELVENAIDAGSTSITIEIEDGGKELIRVIDDGSGIPPADLPLAFAEHATSKLTCDEDLFRITTMGFRGEALASIGAVSHAKILSRVPGEEAAYEILNRGGAVSDAQAAAGNVGTTVEIRNLFFNTPARRKFLRGSSTEAGHVSDMVLRLALPYPQIHFTLLSGGRKLLDLPAAPAEQRLLAAWPDHFSEQRLPVDARDAEVRIQGLVGLPELANPTPKYQYFYLNGRHIRDRFIQHALKEAYRGLIEPGRQPAAVLLLTLPAQDVDVNVHPTKIEVRFRDGGRVHGLLLSAIREKLLGTDLTPNAVVKPAVPEEQRQDMRARLAEFFKQAPPETPAVPTPPVETPIIPPPAPTPRMAEPETQPVLPVNPPFAVARPQAPVPPPVIAPPAAPATVPIPTPPSAPEARPTGTVHLPAMQLHNSYLITESPDGLVIIDQHALHERVIYEELLARLSRGPLESQRLLIPDVIPVSGRQLAILEQIQPLLKQLGIEVSEFGPGSIAIQGFPSFLDRLQPGRFVHELLERGEQEQLDLHEEELLHEILDMMACKAAVKAGDPLSPQEIEALLSKRDEVERSSNCPHGRPTTLRLSLRDLEKQFKRTGF
ncbi:MAG TPA: DNA mismatch repair endonuclease MutL [Tepidisphaeraceae bacterium]|nr:DNA mismatch repair endonuclease MutL [Tepidisphaeraceae bacterium]